MRNIQNTITAVLCLIAFSSPIIKASEDSTWSVTNDIGTTEYDFRGSSDNASLYGLKVERHWNKTFSIYASYHTTGEFHLLDVPRFEANGIEIPGVEVSGDYKDLSVGVTGRISVSEFYITGTVGYTKQTIAASATIPGFGTFGASDGDQSIYYGLGLEIPLSDKWLLNLDFKNNELLTNSEIFSTLLGLEYRF